MEIRLEVVSWAEKHQELYKIRWTVFVEEQKVPEEVEIDEWEDKSLHVLAYNAHNLPLGCGRLLPNGKIGRMAVMAHARGYGVGKAILLRLVDEARKEGHREIALSAQVHALSFYEKVGFEAHGPVYQEDGIPHKAMKMLL